MKEYIVNSLNFKGNDYDEVKEGTYKGEEIVRCKSCKHSTLHNSQLEQLYCLKMFLWRTKNDYCSMGENWLDETAGETE